MCSSDLDFLEPLAAHVIEDASDNLIAGSEKISVSARSALQTLKGLMDDVERMVGTILNSHGGRWAAAEENLFILLSGITLNALILKGGIQSEDQGRSDAITPRPTHQVAD